MGKSPSKFSKRKKREKDEQTKSLNSTLLKRDALSPQGLGPRNTSTQLNPRPLPSALCPLDLSIFLRRRLSCGVLRLEFLSVHSQGHHTRVFQRLCRRTRATDRVTGCCCLSACCFCCGWPSENCALCLNPACIILLFPLSLTLFLSSAPRSTRVCHLPSGLFLRAVEGRADTIRVVLGRTSANPRQKPPRPPKRTNPSIHPTSLLPPPPIATTTTLCILFMSAYHRSWMLVLTSSVHAIPPNTATGP